MHHETTKDELAELINKGFQNMEDRFQGLDKRMDKLENRFDGLERKVEKIDGRLNTLVNVLEKKQVITEADKHAIHA